MPPTKRNVRSSHWQHYDKMYVYSALACLATSILGGFLLRFAFTADPADTGIARNSAIALCCCLILSLPVFLLTLKSSAVGTFATWALTAVIASIAALAGAFGLATPIIAVLVFAASIATSIFHRHRKVVLEDNPQSASVETASD